MPHFRSLPRAFYRRPADIVARALLGRYLVRELPDGSRLAVQILETEAYLGAEDPACHARNGHRSQRNRSMYLDGGHAYVYFVYGMHWCLNVVCSTSGDPHAVLLRAGRAVEGRGRMARNRELPSESSEARLLGGPARLTQALRIDRRFDGCSLLRGPLRITAGEPIPASHVRTTARIGVEYAGEASRWPLRFVAVSPGPPRPGSHRFRSAPLVVCR